MDRARRRWSDSIVSVEPPRILLVIDDAALATALVASLRDNGFAPTAVAGSADAIEAIPGGKFAAVVASQLLKGMDGLALCKKVKETRKDLPFMILGAVASSAAVNDIRKTSGADMVFARTFTAESFLAEIRRKTGVEVAPARGQRSASSGASPAASSAPAQRERVQVPSSGPRVAAPEGNPAPRAVTTPLEPAWLFGQTCASRATGALVLTLSGIERVIHFDQGRPVVATSNVPAERIGQVLVSKGVVGAAELERFLALSVKNNVRLVELLVRQGVITATEQQTMIQTQYVERILAAFAWTVGSVEFKPQPPPPEELPIGLPAGRILVEGLRRHYGVERLAPFFAPDRILRRAPGAENVIPELGFDAIEAAAFLAVDGIRNIGAIASDLDTRPSAFRALHAGICLGLIA